MLSSINQALSLVLLKDRIIIISFGIVRALLGLLDIAGLLLVGILLTNGTRQISQSEAGDNLPKSLSSNIQNLTFSQLTALALTFFLLKSLLATVFMKLMTNKFAQAESQIATKLYSNFLFLPVSEISKKSKNDLTYSFTFAAGYGITNLFSTAIVIVSETFLLISIGVIFALVDFQMTVFIFGYFLLIGLFIHKFIGSRMQKNGRMSASGSITSSTTVEDSISAFREISTQRNQKLFITKFQNSRSDLARSTASIEFLGGLPRHIVESALMVGAVILVSATLTSNDLATAAGSLGVFLTGSLRIMASMLPLQGALGNVKQLKARAEVFFELADLYFNVTPKISEPQARTEIDWHPVGIRIENVSYFYPDAQLAAVQNLNISISKGESVAFIGPSGSGKSTAADLVSGLTIPSAGKITIEGQDFGNYGYVPQSPGVISGTILQNITLDPTSKNFDDNKLKFALEHSHLTELIDSLESGVDTQLGAQHDGLSGGQLQRIGLARALYVMPGLLILDEATSALDAETESAISDSLKSLHGKCTTIVIAHRLSTVQDVDRVFVFDKGQIVAEGKFSELAKSNEIVARYIELSEIKTI